MGWSSLFAEADTPGPQGSPPGAFLCLSHRLKEEIAEIQTAA